MSSNHWKDAAPSQNRDTGGGVRTTPAFQHCSASVGKKGCSGHSFQQMIVAAGSQSAALQNVGHLKSKIFPQNRDGIRLIPSFTPAKTVNSTSTQANRLFFRLFWLDRTGL